MNINKLWMTAQTPSRFVMPIDGHAFRAATGATDACSATTTTVVRERDAVIAGITGAKGDMGLAPSYFPGTNAWSPPTC